MGAEQIPLFFKEAFFRMRIICTRNNLLKSLNISMRAVPSHTTMEILECILIDASSNIIKFISNDMELGIETIVEGTIEERGTAALDAKIFYEIVRKLPDNDVRIHIDENLNTSITCEKARFQIPAKSGDDFSFLPIVDRDRSLTLSQFMLKELIRQTIFSISAADSNPLMTGELFEIRGNILRVVSLDGHRISMRILNLEKDYENEKVIIPGKSLIEISKILSGEIDDTVTLYFSDNHMLFEFENTMVVSRLIGGEYFRIDQMISNEYDTKITVNRKDFMDCIDRSSLLVRESEKKPLIIKVSDDQMDLLMDSSMGRMNEEIDITKEGKDILIGFNPRFFSDALRVIGDEEINIYMVNPKAPCFIRDEKGSYFYLILPVNINQNQYA